MSSADALDLLAAVATPVLGAIYARRCGTFREPARWLTVLGALSLARLAAGALRAGAPLPYVGIARAAWGVDCAAVLGFAMAGVGLAAECFRGTSNDETGSEAVGVRSDLAILVSGSGGGRGERIALTKGSGTGAARDGRTRQKVQASVGGWLLVTLAALSTAFCLAYPSIRGPERIGLALTWFPRACYVAQIAIALRWMVGRWQKSEAPGGSRDLPSRVRRGPLGEYPTSTAGMMMQPRHAVKPAHLIGILYAAGACWDLAGAYAPWHDTVAAWGITRAGNAIGWAAVCLVLAWGMSDRKGSRT